MTKVHHYMVEFEDEHGNVRFANDTDISSLTAAKSLAAQTSKGVEHGAYVVAFEKENGGLKGEEPTFRAIGHISFFDGQQSATDGVVI